MFCRKCGSPIPDDSLFCPKCGTRVDVPSGGPSGFRYAWPPDPAVRQSGLFEFAGWLDVKGRMAGAVPEGTWLPCTSRSYRRTSRISAST